MLFNGEQLDSRTYEYFIEREQQRQDWNVELIASENFPSERVLKAAGSILTNKYSEGYPNKRYYGGCRWIDCIEQKAINDVCKLFHCNYANVQPHCGSSANQAVYRAICKPGDTVLGMDLGAGGHLTHGHRLSFSGQDYNIYSYGVDENGILDYVDLKNKINDLGPRMVIVGASSYSRIIDYERIANVIRDYNEEIRLDVINSTNSDEEADNVYQARKCYYMVDMAHVAGLIAAGVHPNPCYYADVVTSTTHKTLRGPRGGLILWNDEKLTKKINAAVFPGIQGGPLEHIICAKGICFEEAATEEFKRYGEQIIKNAKVFSDTFIDLGWKIISGGTENHMFVLDIYNSIGMTGKEAEIALDRANITVNKNQIPNDELSPLISSGIRIGVPAMTTKGWKEADFKCLAIMMDRYLRQYREVEDVTALETNMEIAVNELIHKINRREGKE